VTNLGDSIEAQDTNETAYLISCSLVMAGFQSSQTCPMQSDRLSSDPFKYNEGTTFVLQTPQTTDFVYFVFRETPDSFKNSCRNYTMPCLLATLDLRKYMQESVLSALWKSSPLSPGCCDFWDRWLLSWFIFVTVHHNAGLLERWPRRLVRPSISNCPTL